MPQIDTVGKQRGAAIPRSEALLQHFARRNATVRFADHHFLHQLHCVLIKPRPFAEVIDTVVDPFVDVQFVHDVSHDRNRGDTNQRTGDLF